jgi:hypothetical protein
MLAWLLQLIGIIPAALNTINGIESAISNEKLAQISAKSQADVTASNERILSLQARRDILVKEAATPSGIWNARIRAGLALGPMLFIDKVLIWDKVVGSFVGCSGKTAPETCGMFNTDPIDQHQWYVIMAVILFYFAAEAYSAKK